MSPSDSGGDDAFDADSSNAESSSAESAAGDPTGRVSRLPLLIMSVVIAMVTLLTLAIMAGRSPVSYPEGSPEAALQRFITAVLDNDEEAVLSLLTDTRQARCRTEIDDHDVYGNRWSENDVRAALDEIDVEGNRATAIVEFRDGGDDDPFGGSSWDYDRRFELLDTPDGWRVDRADWPYSLERCTGGVN